MSTFKSAQVVMTYMDINMTQDAVNITTTAFYKAMDKLIDNKAQYISNEFDRVYGGGWCVFISYNNESETWVTFNHGEYIKLEFENSKIIIFRRGEKY